MPRRMKRLQRASAKLSRAEPVIRGPILLLSEAVYAFLAFLKKLSYSNDWSVSHNPTLGTMFIPNSVAVSHLCGAQAFGCGCARA